MAETIEDCIKELEQDETCLGTLEKLCFGAPPEFSGELMKDEADLIALERLWSNIPPVSSKIPSDEPNKKSDKKVKQNKNYDNNKINSNESFNYLISIGFTPSKVKKNKNLLLKKPSELKNIYEKLICERFSEKEIKSFPQLLNRNPDETIKLFNFYDKITGRNRFWGNKYRNNEGKIMKIPELRESDLSDIKKKYAAAVRALRDNSKYYKEPIPENVYNISSNGRKGPITYHDLHMLEIKRHGRTCTQPFNRSKCRAKEVFATKPEVLLNPGNLEANIEWFYARGIKPRGKNSFLSRPSEKREKMAWLLREVYDIRQVTDKEERSRIMKCMYKNVRRRPGILNESYKTLEERKGELKGEAKQYLNH